MTRTDKENAILEATLSLIAERGFHNTPMSMIAKQASVSAGIVYHYFDNKDALIHELYKDIKRRYAEALLQVDATVGWAVYFEHVWLNAFTFYVSHPAETRFLEQYENSPFGQHISDDAWHANVDDDTRALFESLLSAMQPHIDPALPYAAFYELTLGVALGMAKRQIAQEAAFDESTLRHVAAACRRAIAAN